MSHTPIPEAAPQQWAWLEHAARVGQAEAITILELRARVEHLERMRETEKAAVLDLYEQHDKLKEWVGRNYMRIRALEDEPIQEPAMPGEEPQTLHTIALRMVDTLERGVGVLPGVLPEICDTLRRAIREPMEPTAEPIDEAENDRRFHACMKAIDEATPEQIQALTAPAGSLVEVVAKAIGVISTTQSTARAAILAVAAWLDTRGQHGCSLWLREEVERG